MNLMRPCLLQMMGNLHRGPLGHSAIKLRASSSGTDHPPPARTITNQPQNLENPLGPRSCEPHKLGFASIPFEPEERPNLEQGPHKRFGHLERVFWAGREAQSFRATRHGWEIDRLHVQAMHLEQSV
jgi:hypothetical protein